ncbi:uncharacterized protein LOC124616570 [Schistocerca americana]|uniref:uncharacterized protein LOC124616570 n=1 Tax=Schistocerca americana TaxID=7009 RepID=UPI001F4F3BA2|nr:uncharacterized protein LOC124616570 [Schistocerca americana]
MTSSESIEYNPPKFFLAGLHQVTETIRRCPLLWNTDLEKCRDSNLKDTAWGEIAEQLGQNKANLKEEWRKLRDHHHQALFQKKIKSGQSATKFKPWKYEQQMEFLVTTVKHRKCDTNIPPMDQSVVGGTVPDCDRPLTPGDESITDIEENEEICPLPSTNASTPGESRNHHHRHMDKLINYLQEKPSTKRRAPKADDLDLFFASTCKSIRLLPHFLHEKYLKLAFMIPLYIKENNIFFRKFNVIV